MVAFFGNNATCASRYCRRLRYFSPQDSQLHSSRDSKFVPCYRRLPVASRRFFYRPDFIEEDIGTSFCEIQSLHAVSNGAIRALKGNCVLPILHPETPTFGREGNTCALQDGAKRWVTNTGSFTAVEASEKPHVIFKLRVPVRRDRNRYITYLYSAC